MANNKTVGSSDGRTPFKHFILDKTLGQIVGVVAIGKSTVPAVEPILVIDMCAGDGVSRESGTSSPEIIAKHISYRKLKKPAKAILYEASRETFRLLQTQYGANPSIELRNEDSRTLNLPAEIMPDQAVFIHVDPNSIETFPLTREIMMAMTPTTTFLSTLGCNVNGLKRLPWEKRKPWGGYVRLMVETLTSNHDLIILALDGDCAQWSYLIRVPYKWSNNTEASLRKAGVEFWGKGVSAASYRHNAKGFIAIVQALFLTRDEITQGRTLDDLLKD